MHTSKGEIDEQPAPRDQVPPTSAPLGPKQDIGEEGGWDLYLLGGKMASARPAAASLIDAVHIPHESTAWALAVVPSGRQDELVRFGRRAI